MGGELELASALEVSTTSGCDSLELLSEFSATSSVLGGSVSFAVAGTASTLSTDGALVAALGLLLTDTSGVDDGVSSAVLLLSWLGGFCSGKAVEAGFSSDRSHIFGELGGSGDLSLGKDT